MFKENKAIDVKKPNDFISVGTHTPQIIKSQMNPILIERIKRGQETIYIWIQIDYINSITREKYTSELFKKFTLDEGEWDVEGLMVNDKKVKKFNALPKTSN